MADTKRLAEVFSLTEKGVSTFPRHFHRGKPDQAEASFLPSGTPEEIVRGWLQFARQRLAQEGSHVGS